MSILISPRPKNRHQFGASGVEVAATSLLHGAIRITTEHTSWQRPWRMSIDQYQQLGSCRSWHPGLFRQMARCTAGMFLEFTTDSSEITLEIMLDAEPSATRHMIEIARGVRTHVTCDEIAGDSSAQTACDGISIDIDDRHIPAFMPHDAAQISFPLSEPATSALAGMIQLPGFAGTRHVRIWLPSLRGCVLRSLWGNGSFISPVTSRARVLVLGDSISQGFIVGDSAYSWPSVFADTIGCEILNQSLGGAVFQPGLLWGLAQYIVPACIIVALGTNYRYEPSRPREVSTDIHRYFDELRRVWPHVPVCCIDMFWHNPDYFPPNAMSAYSQVNTFIHAAIAQYDEMYSIDGSLLMEHSTAHLADGYVHPGKTGAAQIAQELALQIPQLVGAFSSKP